MKKLFYYATAILLISMTLTYCITKGTYTGFYNCSLRVDGKEKEQISIDYVGPKKLNELAINEKLSVPYFKDILVNTDTPAPYFSGNSNQFYKIKNTTSSDLYVFYFVASSTAIVGETDYKKDKYYQAYLQTLFNTYRKEDTDPSFSAGKEIQVFSDKKEKYISRFDLYKDLIRLRYPYIKKLLLGEEHILCWGLKWE